MAIFAERRLRDQLGDAWVDKLVVEHNGSHDEAAPEPPKADATPEPTPQAAPAANAPTASDA
jgi:hypothetical protein